MLINELLKLKRSSLPSDFPTITVPPANRVLLADEDAVSFACEVLAPGSPNPTIQWYHNQHLLSQSPNYAINSTSLGGGVLYSELSIMDRLSLASGEVTCEAVVSYVDESGLTRNLTTTATATFTVLGK